MWSSRSATPSNSISRIQRIQNNAARLILRKKRSDHVTPLLKQLHWLPVKQRIEYKLATLAYKHFDNTLPLYLSSSLCSHNPSRSLRSCSQKLLVQPRINLKTAGARSFQYQVPRVWNSLPPHVRQSPTLSVFKTNLKTYLFNLAYQC
jgi:hypothetical protein